MPRARCGSFAGLPEPRQRAERALVATVREAYVQGVSTRQWTRPCRVDAEWYLAPKFAAGACANESRKDHPEGWGLDFLLAAYWRRDVVFARHSVARAAQKGTALACRLQIRSTSVSGPG